MSEEIKHGHSLCTLKVECEDPIAGSALEGELIQRHEAYPHLIKALKKTTGHLELLISNGEIDPEDEEAEDVLAAREILKASE